MLKELLLRWLGQPLLLLALAAVAYLSITNARLKSEQAKRDKITEAALTARAHELDAVKGERASEREILRSLSAELRALASEMKKVDRRVAVASASRSTVTVADTIPGETVTPPSGPSEWRDPHNRFRLILPDGPLERRQRFRFEGVVIRGVRETRFEKVAFSELNPVTGDVIPSDGTVTVEHEFAFTEEAEKPRGWKPRVVVAFDHRGALGIGAQIYDWRSLNLNVVGYHAAGDTLDGQRVHDLSVVMQPAYRLRFPGFDSTVSIGAYVGYSLTGNRVIGGLGATLELTR